MHGWLHDCGSGAEWILITNDDVLRGCLQRPRLQSPLETFRAEFLIYPKRGYLDEGEEEEDDDHQQPLLRPGARPTHTIHLNLLNTSPSCPKCGELLRSRAQGVWTSWKCLGQEHIHLKVPIGFDVPEYVCSQPLHCMYWLCGFCYEAQLGEIPARNLMDPVQVPFSYFPHHHHDHELRHQQHRHHGQTGLISPDLLPDRRPVSSEREDPGLGEPGDSGTHHPPPRATGHDRMTPNDRTLTPPLSTDGSFPERSGGESSFGGENCLLPSPPLSPFHYDVIQHIGHPNHSKIASNQRLTKTWRVVNTGDRKWPAGCRVVVLDEAGQSPVEHSQAGTVTFATNFAPELEAGEQGLVEVDLVTPPETGVFRLQFGILDPCQRLFQVTRMQFRNQHHSIASTPATPATAASIVMNRNDGMHEDKGKEDRVPPGSLPQQQQQRGRGSRLGRVERPALSLEFQIINPLPPISEAQFLGYAEHFLEASPELVERVLQLLRGEKHRPGSIPRPPSSSFPPPVPGEGDEEPGQEGMSRRAEDDSSPPLPSHLPAISSLPSTMMMMMSTSPDSSVQADSPAEGLLSHPHHPGQQQQQQQQHYSFPHHHSHQQHQQQANRHPRQPKTSLQTGFPGSRPKARHVRSLDLQEKALQRSGYVERKSWLVRNSGATAWPAETFVSWVSGTITAAEQGRRYYVPAAEPGKEVEVALEVRFPQVEEQRKASGYFRLAYETPEGEIKKFGPRLWVNAEIIPQHR